MSKLWLTETENLIEAIEQEKQILDEEHEKLGRALTAKGEELAHWKAVLQSYRGRQELEAPQPSLFLQGTNLAGLSHRDIVNLVRDQNGGNIPMTQVTELLKSKVTTPSHAASTAYSTVKRLVKQGQVMKVRPGLYKWVNGQQSTPSYSPAEGGSTHRFAVGDRVRVPDNNDDAPSKFLGHEGVIRTIEEETNREAKRPGRTGKLLWSPWYWVIFADLEPNQIFLINEEWLEPA